MKKGTRLYINITNRCNTTCPFCCMYSGIDNKMDMTFDVYKSIIDNCEGDFEVQLEGGEPLVDKQLYLFIEYALSTERCKKVLILTNGLILDKHIKRLANIFINRDVPLEIKISLNYWLLRENPNHISLIKDIAFAVEYIESIKITCNARLRKCEDDIKLERIIKEDPELASISNVYYLQSYGRLSGNKEYESPVIVQNIEKWNVYSVDGVNFGQDLIARSNHEKEIQIIVGKENKSEYN